MDELKFTIIIPTKNRSDTLYWALKTCVEQQYENLEIIVSDNFSNDSTKEVALSFHDSRIRYINTGKALSMSGNWEFALSHVEEGFISFLGDDDAFLPNSISRLNEIIHKTSCEAVNAPCIEYNWPDHIRPLQRNKLFFIKHDINPYPSVKQILLKVLTSELSYATLPWLYKGFVSVTLIKEIKKYSTTFFHSRTPDIYSAIAISSVIDDKKYYYSQIPFAINGASSHSNGVSQDSKIKNSGALEFLSEINIPFHKDLVLCNSIPVYIYECYLQVKDLGLLKNKDVRPVELDKVLENAMDIAQYSDTASYQKIKNAILEMGVKNNSDMNKLTAMTGKYHIKNILSRFANKAKNRYFSQVRQLDMDEYKVKNVYEAAHIADKILKKEIQPASVKITKRIADDIKTIFQK